MGRKELSNDKRSIIRSISLREEEFEFIKDIGDGSLTRGIREMRELSSAVLRLNKDFKLAKNKIISEVERNIERRSGKSWSGKRLNI